MNDITWLLITIGVSAVVSLGSFNYLQTGNIFKWKF